MLLQGILLLFCTVNSSMNGCLLGTFLESGAVRKEQSMTVRFANRHEKFPELVHEHMFGRNTVEDLLQGSSRTWPQPPSPKIREPHFVEFSNWAFVHTRSALCTAF